MSTAKINMYTIRIQTAIRIQNIHNNIDLDKSNLKS